MRSVEHSSVEPSAYTAPLNGGQNGTAGLVPRPKRRHLGRNFALIFLALYAGLNLAIVMQRWGQLNPNLGSQARAYAHIQLSPSQHPWFFPMLALHVLGGAVALATCVLQIWPWLRENHPSIHRRVGSVYIYGGVFTSVVFGLIVEMFWPFSVATMLSQVVVLVLWGFVTVMGLRSGRQGLREEHRRWMLRSFALTVSVLVEVSIDGPLQLLIRTEFHSRLLSNIDAYIQLKDSNENWLGLIIVLLCVEGLLERERYRRVVLGQRLVLGQPAGELREPAPADTQQDPPARSGAIHEMAMSNQEMAMSNQQIRGSQEEGHSD